MFIIQDGRENFYQWDIDRKLIVKDDSINEVHFCNKTDNCSLVCEVYDEDGLRLVNVPNILLQTNWRINVYAYDSQYTKHSDCFKVIGRSKPADYIYTETEVLTYQHLEEEIFQLSEEIVGIAAVRPTYDEVYHEIEVELAEVINENNFASKNDVEQQIADAITGYELTNKEIAQDMIDNSLIDYATKAEVNALHNPLIVTVKGGEVNGNATSSTNQEIFEAVQAGREVYLCLWSGSAYVRATYATATVAWFEASFLSSETVNNKTYNCVKYRVFIIEKDKYKQSSLSIPKVDYMADLEKRLAALEAK